MSTNKTENFELHSWVPEDNFHLDEINENFEKLDKGAIRIAYGSYTGKSDSLATTTQRISLDLGGRTPKAVLVVCTTSNINTTDIRWLLKVSGVSSGGVSVSQNSFTVSNDPSRGLLLNFSGLVYSYIVFY